MSSPFRFSHRPNRAAEIRWREWGPAAFAEAAAADRPLLLSLSALWCQACHEMDQTTYSDPAVIELLNHELIPIRVDADRYPHVQDRYIAAGWPTTAFLTPSGEVLWADTFVDAIRLVGVARGVLQAWRERRAEFEAEVERRRRALEAARSRPQTRGLVRREAADDVLTALRESFDPRNGGFGGAPRFPAPEAIELLYAGASAGDPALLEMADRTLDGMLAGEVLDAVAGGFFRYALAEDWTEPRREKLLDVNAGLLAAFALGAALRGRSDWARTAEGIVAWADRTLALPEGLWAGSQLADEDWFSAAGELRATLAPPPVDATIYTATNARWIAALAEAGGRLRRPEWCQRAAAALERLQSLMGAPGGMLYHYRDPVTGPAIDNLLMDVAETARAALAVHRATGSTTALADARRLARVMEERLWATDGGFWDRLRAEDDVGALRYRDRPFEANAAAARLLLDLHSATSERGWRALAERILALLSPQAGRWGAAGATFALATEEFFSPPARIILVGDPDATAELRQQALALTVPGVRVWTAPAGGRFDNINIPAEPRPAAWICTPRGRSRAITAPADLAAALARLL